MYRSLKSKLEMTTLAALALLAAAGCSAQGAAPLSGGEQLATDTDVDMMSYQSFEAAELDQPVLPHGASDLFDWFDDFIPDMPDVDPADIFESMHVPALHGSNEIDGDAYYGYSAN